MLPFRLSDQATHDIEDILAWTHQHFGDQARLRYEALIAQAIWDLALDPSRFGCHPRSELADGAMTYHLRHSRDHVGSPPGRVRKPRHFLVCRVGADGRLEIGRVLHDSMDTARHLPFDDRSEEQEPNQ